MIRLGALIWLFLINITDGLSNGSDASQFQRCFDEGESYSASFLTHIEHFRDRDLDYGGKITTELASFILLETRHGRKDKPEAIGQMIRTRDMLEFAVLHLSTMERTHRMLQKSSRSLLGKMRAVANEQRSFATAYRAAYKNNNDKTLAIMPFVGTRHSRDAGNSAISNRRLYLEASFWNVVHIYPHVVIGCCFKEDLEMIRNELKLPVFEILLIPSCAEKPEELPFQLLREIQRRLMSRGIWHTFKYVFYTESDQMVVVREQEQLFAYLDAHPKNVLLPHRLIPYSDEVLGQELHSSGIERRLPRLLPHESKSLWRCCLPMSSCSGNLTALVPLKRAMKSSTVPMLNIAGLSVVMGTANFLYSKFRFCQFLRRDRGPCPHSLLW